MANSPYAECLKEIGECEKGLELKLESAVTAVKWLKSQIIKQLDSLFDPELKLLQETKRECKKVESELRNLRKGDQRRQELVQRVKEIKTSKQFKEIAHTFENLSTMVKTAEPDQNVKPLIEALKKRCKLIEVDDIKQRRVDEEIGKRMEEMMKNIKVVYESSCDTCQEKLGKLTICGCGLRVCEKCSKKCATCDTGICGKCLKKCESCRESEICSKCPKKCQACEVTGCKKCVRKCDSCTAEICKACPKKCEVCGSSKCKKCIQKCKNCQKEICEKCPKGCECCQKESCIKCLVKCNNCTKDCCAGCMKKCEGCTKDFCKKCYKQCKVCSKEFCEKCLKKCLECKTETCEKCLKTCGKCGSAVCVTCVGKKCLKCNEIGCQNCMKTCTKCNKQFCSKCTRMCTKCKGFHCSDCYGLWFNGTKTVTHPSDKDGYWWLYLSACPISGAFEVTAKVNDPTGNMYISLGLQQDFGTNANLHEGNWDISEKGYALDLNRYTSQGI
jgi:hypothetical protein